VPDVLIVAIASVDDNADLEKKLAQCGGLHASRVTLFTTGHTREVPARLRTHFIPSGPPPVASGSHGTNVPGMGTTSALNASVADAAGMDHLNGIGITPDAAHYYNIAIDEGRTVVSFVLAASKKIRRFHGRGISPRRRCPSQAVSAFWRPRIRCSMSRASRRSDFTRPG